MRGSSTVVINGKVYDAVSGLAVAHPNPTQHSEAQAHTNEPVARKSPLKPSHHSTAQNTAKTKHNHATRSHSRTQRSTTLRRDVLKKPESKQHLVRRKPATGSIAKSPHVRRFAPHPARIDAIVPVKTVPATKQQTPQKEVLPVSPIVTQAHAKVAQHKARVLETQPKCVRDLAWKTQERLCKRYRSLQARGKKSTVIVAAIARELAGFVWALGQEMQPSSR